MKSNSIKIKRMAGIAILISVTVALQFFGNYINFGILNINLALITIIIGACLYGPKVGLILGLIDGAIVCTSPSTIAFFMTPSGQNNVSVGLVFATIFVCLVKTGIAGLLSGIVFKYLKNVNFTLAIVLASVIVPIVNTGLFIVGCYTLFNNMLSVKAGEATLTYLVFVVLIGFNFFFELPAISLLTPGIGHVIKIITKNKTLGFTYEKDLETNI
ncbi:MAG: ECF transporter S component [Bacillales bacterium]|nr:ECF transporter S component [Bacillales bacterium]